MNKRTAPKQTGQWIQVAFSLMVVASLLAGCRFPWQPSQSQQTLEAGRDVPEASGSPTSEPRKDLPPALVEVSPLPDSIISRQQPITLYFNQAMNTASVEAAIHFNPQVAGEFIWEDDQTLIFTPDQPLHPGTILQLNINTSAQADNRKSLQTPLELSFKIAENLQVVQTLPSDGAADVDPEGAIFTAFNQPVVALGGEAEAAAAFSLSPDVPGSGQWINTSTYIFYPSPSLAGGMTYTVQMNQDLQSTSGAGFDTSRELDFSFSTTLPEVMKVLPLPDERLSLDGPISIHFNIRMDPESVEEHFILKNAAGTQIGGAFEWDEDQKTVSFTPSQLLVRNAVYTISLSSEAKSFGGQTLETPVNTARTTHPVFTRDSEKTPAFDNFYGNYGQYRVYLTTELDQNTFEDHITLTPEIQSMNTYLGDQNTSLSVNGYFQPETQYTLTLDRDLQDKWGGRLGQEITYTFSTPAAETSLSVITGGYSQSLVFIPRGTSELVMQATNINTLTLEISPISLDDLMTLLHPDNYNYRQLFMPESVERSTRNLDLTRNISEMIRIPLTFQGQPLEPGVYYLALSSQDLPADSMHQNQKLYLIVSDNHLVMKMAPEQALIWATQLSDYSPLANAPISIYTTKGELLASGATDSDGIFDRDLEHLDEPYSSFITVVGEPGQDDFAFSISSWGGWYSLYESGIRFDSAPARTDAYIFTDRPIYRPGDTVHFKALIFDRDNGLPTASGQQSVKIKLFGDPGMAGIPTALFDEELTLSDYGTVAGTVTLQDDAPPGYYHIEVQTDEETWQSLYFEVAAYRKPDIELEVVLEPAELTQDDTLTTDIQANYYFGIPVSGQTFSWALYRDTAYFDLHGYQAGPVNTAWLTLPNPAYSALGELIASGEAETDAVGTASLEFSLAEFGIDDSEESSPNEYHLEVTLMDESGFPVSNRASALVHPADFYIGVQAESYFGIAETPFSFSIQTVEWDLRSVGNRSLQAIFESIEWEVEATSSFEQPYRYIETTEFIASASPVTDSEGKARLSFTPPEPGTYRLTVRSGDAVTQIIVWVSGSSSAIWPRQIQNNVKLTPDAESYQPGQRAEVFFPNPFTGPAKALVTIERGKVMETEIIEITGSGHTLKIDLSEESIPNIYISLMLLGKNENGEPDFRQGIINLPVEPVNKTLDVKLAVDPTQTEPGETVTATLTIKDGEGNPVQGEFSVAVVDKALLALVEPNSPRILDALYGNRPLTVQTSFSLKTYATQLALSNMDLGRGGGGDESQLLNLREDFPDTAFWNAKVVTGADGTARLEFPLPDTLTTWVVDVRGLTQDFQVGQAEAEIVSQKELMIRPITPRFLVDGDEVELAAVVHNNSKDTLNVNVSLQGVGFSLLDSAQQTQTVTLLAGESVRVNWWGTVDSVEMVDLVFRATSGNLSDASTPVWGDLSVLSYAVPNTFSTSGQLTGADQRLELVSLPVTADLTAGSLFVELTPSLTASLVESLKALEAAPYQDTVSILARLLANLNAYQALTDLGIDSPQLRSNLENLVNKGLRQLLEAQHFNGGWSWWTDDEAATDPFITAYVLMGLQQAADAGLEVGDPFIERAVEYLTGQIVQPGEIDTSWQLDRLVFQVYVLSETDHPLETTLDGLYARRSELSPWALALLALTIQNNDGNNTRVNTLLGDLEASAIRSATGVHWESDNLSWLVPGTPVFNTAVSVYALAQLDPASTSLSMALRYLLAHRKTTDLWASTFETSWSLMAITKALQGTGDYQADYDFQAILNDVLIAEGSASGTDTLNVVTSTTAIKDLYPDSPNALSIERGDGIGTLYYRADLQTFQPAATAEAINKGISLTRDYYLAGEGCPGGDDCSPIASLILDPADPTQFITAVITVNISHDMYHLLIEDYFPAGTEPLNQNFLTSQALPKTPENYYDPRSPFTHGWGWWFFNEPQIHDDHVLWAADYVPAGTYVLTYNLLPYQRGNFQVIPVHAWQYFFPEVMGTSAGSLFSIE